MRRKIFYKEDHKTSATLNKGVAAPNPYHEHMDSSLSVFLMLNRRAINEGWVGVGTLFHVVFRAGISV